MHSDLVVALAVGIGFVAGLRSLTAPAATSWAACAGWLDLHGSPLAFMGSRVAVVIFSLLAILEYVADQLPSTPRRTTPGPLVARIVTGELSGACLCASAGRSLALGGALGGLGARTRLVKALKVKDRVIALSEDLVAIALAWLFVAGR